MGTTSRPPFCEETCTGAPQALLDHVAVLTTALLVSSTSEAIQPRTPHPYRLRGTLADWPVVARGVSHY